MLLLIDILGSISLGLLDLKQATLRNRYSSPDCKSQGKYKYPNLHSAVKGIYILNTNRFHVTDRMHVFCQLLNSTNLLFMHLLSIFLIIERILIDLKFKLNITQTDKNIIVTYQTTPSNHQTALKLLLLQQ